MAVKEVERLSLPFFFYDAGTTNYRDYDFVQLVPLLGPAQMHQAREEFAFFERAAKTMQMDAQQIKTLLTKPDINKPSPFQYYTSPPIDDDVTLRLPFITSTYCHPKTLDMPISERESPQYWAYLRGQKFKP